MFDVNDAVNDTKGTIRLQLIIVACQNKYQYLSVFVGQVCIRSLLHASRTLNEFADCFPDRCLFLPTQGVFFLAGARFFFLSYGAKQA